MSFRPFSLAVLTAALCVPSLQTVRADDPPAPNPQTAQQAPGGDDDRPRPNRDGFGGPPGGGPDGNFGGRGPGGFGGRGGRGPREGRLGGEGGPRGGGGPMFEALRQGETPEQFHERAMAPYLEIVPDLNDAQKTHIYAIMDAATAELNAARQDRTLSQQRQRAALFYIRGDVSNRVMYALTEEQLATFNQYLVQQRAAQAALNNLGSTRPGEDLEQMRARLLVGYEDVMEELSVKQKTDILKILQDASDQSDTIKANTALSDADKLAALRKVHDDVSAKVLPMLDADQAAVWKKAHAAKRP